MIDAISFYLREGRPFAPLPSQPLRLLARSGERRRPPCAWLPDPLRCRAVRGGDVMTIFGLGDVARRWIDNDRPGTSDPMGRERGRGCLNGRAHRRRRVRKLGRPGRGVWVGRVLRGRRRVDVHGLTSGRWEGPARAELPCVQRGGRGESGSGNDAGFRGSDARALRSGPRDERTPAGAEREAGCSPGFGPPQAGASRSHESDRRG